MATYFVDSAATGTGDGSTWANAYTSIAALSTALSNNFGGHTVYVADTHNEAGTAAAKTLNATSRAVMISSDVGAGTDVSYLKGTGNQYYTGDGSYDITIDGSWEIYGIRFVSGDDFVFTMGVFEPSILFDCTLAPANGRAAISTGTVAARFEVSNCVIDLSADSGDQSGPVFVFPGNPLILRNCSFTSAANRTGAIFIPTSAGIRAEVSGCDFSGFTNATTCEIVDATDLVSQWQFTDCKTKSSPTLVSTAIPRQGTVLMMNVGAADEPRQLLWKDRFGITEAQTGIYRTDGAVVEGAVVAWKVVTSANASEGVPHQTPWCYGVSSAVGSKTFTIYVAQDGGSADLTDAEIWMEVEYLGTENSPLYTLGSDHRVTITTTPAAQADDTVSTWTGITATYKQALAVTATVGEAGLYRARVCVAKASTTVYVDPKVTVS